MLALRMNGKQISSYNRLRENINPKDIIEQRRAFAAFSAAHLRFSAINRYNADMFAAAVKLENPESAALAANDYWDNPFGLELREDEIMSRLSEYRQPDASGKIARDKMLAEQIFQAVKQSDLAEREKFTSFYLLTAAYLLADANISDTDLTAALKGEAVTHEHTPNGWTPLPSDSDELSLRARKDGYRFKLYTDAALPKDGRIRTLRITAAEPQNGSRYLNASLNFYRNDADADATVALKPGEFIYLNAVGDRVVKLLDTAVSNGKYCLKRENLSEDGLCLTAPNEGVRKLPSMRCKGASSFAVEGGGYLIIQNNRLNTGSYPNRNNYPQLSTLEYRSVVEVSITGGEYLVLQDNGRVFSSRPAWDELRGLPSLDCVTSEVRNDCI